MGDQISSESRDGLISELSRLGVKHTATDIVAIARCPDGRIVFLEQGDSQCGLQHILLKKSNFADRGIAEEQIVHLIMKALVHGKLIGRQGKSRDIYQVNFGEEEQYVSITVASNGFVVGANPTERRLIRKFTAGGEHDSDSDHPRL